jgi:hypothetical protein
MSWHFEETSEGGNAGFGERFGEKFGEKFGKDFGGNSRKMMSPG